MSIRLPKLFTTTRIKNFVYNTEEDQLPEFIEFENLDPRCTPDPHAIKEWLVWLGFVPTSFFNIKNKENGGKIYLTCNEESDWYNKGLPYKIPTAVEEIKKIRYPPIRNIRSN